MTIETRSLEMNTADLESFVLCLTLGTLEAIRGGHLPPEAGIWSLGRPAFWQPLESAGLAPELIELPRSADELALLTKLGELSTVNAAIDQMIGVVRSRLAALPE